MYIHVHVHVYDHDDDYDQRHVLRRVAQLQ